jgi:16S rRNA (uracil1498-N3)-methyltransferase
MDGAGSEWIGWICSIQKRCVEIQVETINLHLSPTWRCVLVQSWLKGKNMDWVIQKATELGVTDIVPMWTQRSEVRLKSKDVSSKLEKWNIAIQEACKQCGRFNAPTLHPPLTFEKSLKEWAAPDSLIALTAALTPETKTIRQVLEQHPSEDAQQTNPTVSLWIGPEGDFTDSEYQILSAAGAHPVRLTPHILRSETAAVTGLAILINELTR